MMTINLRRLLTNAGLLSLALIYMLLWINMIDDPKQRTGSDFIGFYSFGRIAQTQGFENIYNVKAQQNIEEGVVGFQVIPEFYTHVPFTAALADLIVDSNYVNSFIRWAIVLLFLNAASSYLLVNDYEGKFRKRRNFYSVRWNISIFPRLLGIYKRSG